MKKIAAIVVTYNRKELLAECIRHLFAQSMRQEMDIVIVDNASTDGTGDELKKWIEGHELIYVNTGANLGGAGGFCCGMRYAVEQGYEYLWVMDDDSMPREDALWELVKADRRLQGKYGFLSGKVLWKDGSICNMNLQKRSISGKVQDFTSEQTPVVSASFVSIFLRSEVVRKVGLPIRDFFIWGDDLEYTLRISEKYPCYMVASSVVIHKTANNAGSNIAQDVPERVERYWYAYRNEVYVYRRAGLRGRIYWISRLLLHISRVLLQAKNNKCKRLAVIWKGTMDGCKFHPEIEQI